MKIKVNNEVQDALNGLSITELLIANKVDMPEMVSVQLNGEFIQQDSFSQITLKENDDVDFLYFMGGGTSHDRV